jgi:hypothetical protein
MQHDATCGWVASIVPARGRLAKRGASFFDFYRWPRDEVTMAPLATTRMIISEPFKMITRVFGTNHY